MRNVKINEAETIFEPFWDSGESYPDHQKYTCLSRYRIETDGRGSVDVGWQSVCVSIQPGKTEGYPVRMSRTCALDISGYDRFRLFASVSESLEFRIVCDVDGTERTVIHARGNNSFSEYTQPIQGSRIRAIRLEFQNLSEMEGFADLCWMGLSNAEREKRMLAEPSPYTPDWEGCFREDAELAPQAGVYFDAEGLRTIREKIRTPLFAPIMQRLRDSAQKLLTLQPEKDIGPYVSNHYRNFVRDRDFQKMDYATESMTILAFTGLVDENLDMMRMACRIALSVAHCDRFCESIMGAFPGATWHHRSFLEANMGKQIMRVLDWAGGLLTWHGKNILYDAVIMKALPRIDADIKTMDYIWTMNQGIVFSSELVEILMGLERRYPRYAGRVAEAEQDLLTMWDTYVRSDGGTSEGPAYWEYTLGAMSTALYLLARYRKQTLKDYVPSTMRKTALFAEAMLSDTGNVYVPVNDAHANAYDREVVALMAQLDVGDYWKQMSNGSLLSGSGSWRSIIFEDYFPDVRENVQKHAFLSFPEAGHTTLRRQTEDMGTVGLHVISGAVTFGHGHADKGSFILEAGGRALLIDRGVCAYGDPYINLIWKSELHNMTVAVQGGQFLCQRIDSEAFSGIVLDSRYEDGIFTHETDVTPCWDGAFEQNIRRIVSKDPYHYEITDTIRLGRADAVCFVLNTRCSGALMPHGNGFCLESNGIRILVLPKNWKPERISFELCAADCDRNPVNRLCMFAPGSKSCELLTELVLTAVQQPEGGTEQ